MPPAHAIGSEERKVFTFPVGVIDGTIVMLGVSNKNNFFHVMRHRTVAKPTQQGTMERRILEKR